MLCCRGRWMWMRTFSVGVDAAGRRLTETLLGVAVAVAVQTVAVAVAVVEVAVAVAEVAVVVPAPLVAVVVFVPMTAVVVALGVVAAVVVAVLQWWIQPLHRCCRRHRFHLFLRRHHLPPRLFPQPFPSPPSCQRLTRSQPRHCRLHR